MRVIHLPVFGKFVQNAVIGPTLVYRWNIRLSYEIGIVESISGDTFVTGSRINVLTVHVQTLWSQKSPSMVSRARNDRVFIEKRCAEFKYNVRFQAENIYTVEIAHAQWQIVQIGEKHRRAAKVFTS